MLIFPQIRWVSSTDCMWTLKFSWISTNCTSFLISQLVGLVTPHKTFKLCSRKLSGHYQVFGTLPRSSFQGSTMIRQLRYAHAKHRIILIKSIFNFNFEKFVFHLSPICHDVIRCFLLKISIHIFEFIIWYSPK